VNNQIDARYLLGLANSKLISWYGGLMLPNFGKDIFPLLSGKNRVYCCNQLNLIAL
jgi:hypothetical protein